MSREPTGYVLIAAYDGYTYTEYDQEADRHVTVMFESLTNATDAANASPVDDWCIIPVFAKPKYKREKPHNKGKQKWKRRNGYLPEDSREL